MHGAGGEANLATHQARSAVDAHRQPQVLNGIGVLQLNALVTLAELGNQMALGVGIEQLLGSLLALGGSQHG